MKFNHMLGILGGLLFSVIALTWWTYRSESSGPSARCAAASESNSVSENRTRFSEPQELADDTARKLTAELPGAATLEGRCLQLAEHDPCAALTLAIDTRSYDTHPGLLENLAGQWATRDFQASYQWVLQQQPGERREGLLARVAFVGSQSDPVAAAHIVTDEMTPGQIQTEAAISVLHQWALRDLNAAAAWASAFPEGPLRQRAMDEIEGIRNVLRTGEL